MWQRQSSGVTLIELLTALALLAMLGALAAPSLSTLRLNASRTAAVNDFFHAIFLARSAAVQRSRVVSLCRSLDRQRCTHSAPDWTTGWIVFVNRDRDEPPERDEGEELIAAYAGWQDGRITSNRVAYSFRPYYQGVVNGTVVFCDRRGASHARAVIISHTGRPRVSQRDASNKPLRCAPG